MKSLNHDLGAEYHTTLCVLTSIGISVAEDDHEEVVNYLRRYPGILDSIQLAQQRLRALLLGEIIEVTAAIYHDPEIRDEYLTLRVRARVYDHRTMAALDAAFDAAEPMLSKSDGWMIVTTDFVALG